MQRISASGIVLGSAGHRARPNKRDRWLHGLWKAAERGVFPEFDEDRHVIRPFAVPPAWPHYWWWDPGYDHPTGLVCVAVAPTGAGTRYYVVDEIKAGGLDVESHCTALREHNRRAPGRLVLGYYGDPMHAFSSTAQSPETIAAKFRRHMGISMYPGPRMNDKGHKEAAVERVREWLIGPKDSAGNREPRIKVFDTCVETINEFQSWKYRRDTKNQVLKGDDMFEDKNNDLLDGLLGLVDLNLPATPGSIRVVRS